MKKSLITVCAALVAAPLIAVVGTPSPAAAASNCGPYPPAQNFEMRNSPDPRIKGAVQPYLVYEDKAGARSVVLSARLFRNGKPCPQHKVYFYFHGPTDFKNGVATYHYSQSPALTDNYGLAKITVTVKNSFRWFVDYNVPVTYPVTSHSTSSGANTDGQSLVKPGCRPTDKHKPCPA